jgi:Prokaryotic E2 family E
MTPIDHQLAQLSAAFAGARAEKQSNGAYNVEIPGYVLPSGWNTPTATIIFQAPPGYPGAQPDCFWLEADSKQPIRLANGGTPQASNDSNPIPGGGPRGTWFSWHLGKWDPNRDTLLSYVHVIQQRLNPAR